MNVTRKNETITIELTPEQAAVLAAEIAGSRVDAMTELCERILGSPIWRHRHEPSRAHRGVVDAATYEAAMERNHL